MLVIESQDLRAAAEVYELRESMPVAINGAGDVEAVKNLMQRAGALYKIVEKRRAMFKEPVTALGKQIDQLSDQIRAPMKEIEAHCKQMLTRHEMERQMAAQAVPEEDAAEGRQTPNLTEVVPVAYTPKVHTRSIPKVRVVDAALIPAEYWIPDMAKIEKDALAGKPVPGVEVFNEMIVVNR